MQAGDLFAGKYIIVDILGRGGMGTVYLGRNIKTEKLWAIKEINRIEEPEIDVTAEYRLLKKIEHPALPRLFDIVEEDGRLYVISDYVEGISLDKKLEKDGPVDEDTAVDWGIQLCEALQYLHSLKPYPIIYRDMKPSNIILTDSGILKLVDFGIAREYKPQSKADTVYIGTRGYAAPEQYGAGQTSAASDIYSLGVTLHHLLTGKSPLEPPMEMLPVRHFNEGLSEKLEEIIIKCTRENPDERFQSASELLMELKALQDSKDKQEDGYFSENDEAIPSRQQASFRKIVITVWDNAEFGCELAYMAAKHTGGEVVLADIDLLSPKADIFLDLKKYPSRYMQGSIFGQTGLDMVMDAISKGSLTAGLLKKALTPVKGIKNLHILTGNFRLENYEYYSEDSIPKLIDKCYRTFDITILLANRWIYDAFTLAALLKSDINIAAVDGSIAEFREFNTYISFLKEKQHLPLEATKFVLFNYDKTVSMPLAEAKAACEGNLLGTVSASRRRLLYRCIKGSYAAHMDKEVENEYIKLLKKLGLIQAPSAIRKLKGIIGR